MLVAAAPPSVECLYVHVPFCARKCDYCAFYSEAVRADEADRYVAALIQELRQVASRLKPKTVFIGGGTPSLLTLPQWERVLGAFHSLGLGGATEWTVECNPATISLEKARLLRAGGVNRISLGLQSLDDHLLERLGRIHSRKTVFESYDLIRRAGFSNVNLDVMFAIPGQTLAAWQTTLKECFQLGPEHLACYEVIYEEDTPLYAQLQAGQIEVDDELAGSMYETLRDLASANGYLQYEVANFARDEAAGSHDVPSFACRHNVNYWRGGDYIGCGPSACTYLEGERRRNWPNTTLYCSSLESGKAPVEYRERLRPLARAGELAAFGLRMTRGWRYEEFESRTGYALRDEWRSEIERLTGLGYGVDDGTSFRLTRPGIRYADWAAELFLRPEEG